MLKFFNGMPVVITNKITNENKEEKYHISYNPSARDYGVDTTALVINIGDNERDVYYILSGNHSEQYGNCKNLKECLTYYTSNKELQHKFSSEFEH